MGLLLRLAVIWAMAGLIFGLSGCALEFRMKRIDTIEETTHMDPGSGFLSRAMDWMFTDSTKKEKA